MNIYGILSISTENRKVMPSRFAFDPIGHPAAIDGAKT